MRMNDLSGCSLFTGGWIWGLRTPTMLDPSVVATMDKDALKKQIENMKYQATMERWPLSKSITAWVTLYCYLTVKTHVPAESLFWRETGGYFVSSQTCLFNLFLNFPKVFLVKNHISKKTFLPISEDVNKLSTSFFWTRSRRIILLPLIFSTLILVPIRTAVHLRLYIAIIVHISETQLSVAVELHCGCLAAQKFSS